MPESSPFPNFALVLIAISSIWLFAKFMPYIAIVFISLLVLGSIFPDDILVEKAQAGVAQVLGPAAAFYILWLGIRVILRVGTNNRPPS